MPKAEKLQGINQNTGLKDAKLGTAELGDNSLGDSCDMYWLRNIDYN